MKSKTNLAAALTLAGATLTSSSAIAAGSVQVSESVEINAKPAAVWALVGDYNGLYRWHPAVKESDRTDNIRLLTLGNGAQIIETLTAMNNEKRIYNYTIIASPLPVSDYESSIAVKTNGSNGSVVTWSSSFNAAGISHEEAAKVIRGVYQAGLNKLTELYN
jgi:mxaD protein